MKKEFILNGKSTNEILRKAGTDHLAKEFNKQLNFVHKTGNAIDVAPLMAISAEVIEEKFYRAPIADVMPVRVGNNSWGFGTIHYMEQTKSAGFEAGIIGRGAKNSNLADVDVDLDAVLREHVSWAKQITYSIAQLQTFSALNNYDYAIKLERARKRDWDLGLEKIAFTGGAGVTGFFNTADISLNTSAIPKRLSIMTEAELSALPGQLLTLYRTNNGLTAWPSVFTIPESDYLGLTGPFSTLRPEFTKLMVLEEAFKRATQNPNFKIVPIAYATGAGAPVSGASRDRYVLSAYDEDSLYLDIPVDYQTTQFGTSNGFHFQNVGLGQIGGTFAARPKEIMYFDVNPSAT